MLLQDSDRIVIRPIDTDDLGAFAGYCIGARRRSVVRHVYEGGASGLPRGSGHGTAMVTFTRARHRIARGEGRLQPGGFQSRSGRQAT